MKYMYLGGGASFLEDLPARDLTTDELSSEQLEILEVGVRLGLYEKSTPEVPQGQTPKKGSGDSALSERETHESN